MPTLLSRLLSLLGALLALIFWFPMSSILPIVVGACLNQEREIDGGGFLLFWLGAILWLWVKRNWPCLREWWANRCLGE